MSDSSKQAPNVIGTWVGKTNDAVIGGGSHYPDGEPGEVRFLGLTVTYQFNKQSNRAFAGIFTIEVMHVISTNLILPMIKQSNFVPNMMRSLLTLITKVSLYQHLIQWLGEYSTRSGLLHNIH